VRYTRHLTGLPDVFARVSDGFDWIKTTVCREIPDDGVFCVTARPTSAPTASKAAKKQEPAGAKSTKSPVTKVNKSKASK
jgi:hypothetical protein